MNAINKNLVKKQFNNGLKSYANEASVQKEIAKKLIEKFNLLTDRPLSKLFEVGCGTGFLTQNIMEKLKFDHLIVNDISTTSKQKIQELETVYKKVVDFIEGDAEEIVIPQQLDAVISSSTIQWFEDIPAFFEKTSRSLNNGGFLAISTFGCNNFKEIKSITGIGLDYLSLHELTDLLSRKFNVLLSEEWTEEKYFSNPLDVLMHMKQTGVNGINKKPFGIKQLNDFTRSYKTIYAKENQNIPLTYNPIIIIAQKNNYV